MDANQLIRALGDASAAAKPPQEYCLLWLDWWPLCMTKSEWAGWAQVVGALAALAIAIGLPFWQKRTATKEDFNRMRQCLLLQCGLVSAIRSNAGDAKEGPRYALSNAVKECADLLHLYDDVRLPQISLGQLAVFRAARITARQLAELIDSAAAGGIADTDVNSALNLLMDASVKQLKQLGEKPER